MTPIIVIGVILLLIIALTCATLWSVLFYKIALKRIDLAERSIYYSANITMDIPKLLDDIINECFLDYQVAVLAPRRLDYIGDDEEAQIKHDLAVWVSNRISNAALEKIGLFYNKGNLASIIAEKIDLVVLNYTVKNNAPKNG